MVIPHRTWSSGGRPRVGSTASLARTLSSRRAKGTGTPTRSVHYPMRPRTILTQMGTRLLWRLAPHSPHGTGTFWSARTGRAAGRRQANDLVVFWREHRQRSQHLEIGRGAARTRRTHVWEGVLQHDARRRHELDGAGRAVRTLGRRRQPWTQNNAIGVGAAARLGSHLVEIPLGTHAARATNQRIGTDPGRVPLIRTVRNYFGRFRAVDAVPPRFLRAGAAFSGAHGAESAHLRGADETLLGPVGAHRRAALADGLKRFPLRTATAGPRLWHRTLRVSRREKVRRADGSRQFFLLAIGRHVVLQGPDEILLRMPYLSGRRFGRRGDRAQFAPHQLEFVEVDGVASATCFGPLFVEFASRPRQQIGRLERLGRFHVGKRLASVQGHFWFATLFTECH